MQVCNQCDCTHAQTIDYMSYACSDNINKVKCSLSHYWRLSWTSLCCHSHPAAVHLQRLTVYLIWNLMERHWWRIKLSTTFDFKVLLYFLLFSYNTTLKLIKSNKPSQPSPLQCVVSINSWFLKLCLFYCITITRVAALKTIVKNIFYSIRFNGLIYHDSHKNCSKVLE